MKLSIRSLSLCALMCALMCMLSCVALPIGTIPLTLQTFAVALCGYILHPKEAFFSVLAYLLLGACGLPVFSLFQGGIGMIFGATGGFLMGFPLMAWLCASAGKKHLWKQILMGILGLLIVYGIGVIHLSRTTQVSLYQAALSGIVPFVWKDALSLAGGLFTARSLRRRILLWKNA